MEFLKNIKLRYLFIFLALVICVMTTYYFNNIPVKISFIKPVSGNYSFNGIKSVSVENDDRVKVYLPAGIKKLDISIANNVQYLTTIKIGKKSVANDELFPDLILKNCSAKLLENDVTEITPTTQNPSIGIKSAGKIIKTRQITTVVLGILGLFLSYLICVFVDYYLKNKEKFDLNFVYKAAFWISLAISFGFLLRWIGLPLLDAHGFRQTQTAINAYYLLKDFDIFHYQTPVLGYPWSLPFEFPIYQALVVLLCKFTHINLEISGRIVSWSGYILTLYPIYKICRKFEQDKNLFYIISSLYLLSPTYLFWGRTFMIETTTVFFAAMFLWYFIKLVDEKKPLDFVLCLIFSLLCALSKVTTYPAFVMAGGIYLCYKIFKEKKVDYFLILKLAFIGIITLIPVSLWIHHTDVLKMQNLLGATLTSKSLSAWNYGTLSQRLSLEFYRVLVFERIIPCVFGNIFAFILALAAFILAPRNYKKIVAVFILVFLAPIAVFSNLYYIHTYYLCANAIFLIAAIGISIFAMTKTNKTKLAVPLFVIILVIMFMSVDFRSIKNSRDHVYYQLAKIVKNNTPENSALVVMGIDWSSEIHYYSQRKGLGVPFNIKDEISDKLINDSTGFFDGIPLSAIIYIPTNNPKMFKIKERLLQKHPDLKPHKKIQNVEIYY